MSQKFRRYTLKSKESKQLVEQASERLKINIESLFGSKTTIEVVEADAVEVLLVEGLPMLFKIDNEVLPTLMSNQILTHLPKAVIDMGAVRFVCNGADIMAPGILRYEGIFTKGDIVVVVDEKHGKPLALGEALYGSEQSANVEKGPVIKSKHYVSDKIWNLAKTVAE
jgi:PUA domain protein